MQITLRKLRAYIKVALQRGLLIFPRFIGRSLKNKNEKKKKKPKSVIQVVSFGFPTEVNLKVSSIFVFLSFSSPTRFFFFFPKSYVLQIYFLFLFFLNRRPKFLFSRFSSISPPKKRCYFEKVTNSYRTHK